MAKRHIPASICRVPATIGGRHFLEPTDSEVIAKINLLLVEHDYKLEPLSPEQIIVENGLVRCSAKSPGGTTDDGILPRKGSQCGLHAGHDGEHSVLVPSDAPWSSTKKWATSAAKVKSPRQVSRAQQRVNRLFSKTARGVRK